MAFIVIERIFDPEDDGYISFLGTASSLDEATELVRKRFDYTWSEYVATLGPDASFSYEIVLGDTAVGAEREPYMGKTAGYVAFDNEWDKYIWIVFDEDVKTTVVVP